MHNSESRHELPLRTLTPPATLTSASTSSSRGDKDASAYATATQSSPATQVPSTKKGGLKNSHSASSSPGKLLPDLVRELLKLIHSQRHVSTSASSEAMRRRTIITPRYI